MTKTLQNVETITCDQCGKTQSRDCSQQFFGGHPFNGWYHLNRHGGSTSLEDLQKESDWDFCGILCLSIWADGQ